MRSFMPTAVIVLVLALIFPAGALAATASAPAATEAGQPFPTNLYTVRDEAQITGVRIDLPKPDCATHPSDCADVDVLDTLDGFNVQPRISIPFSAPIDLSTVTSSTVFLVGPQRHVVGINQAVWEPLTNTLHVESDEQLMQDTTYLLVVTRGIRGADGKPLAETDFRRDLNFGHTKDRDTKAYRKELLEALPMAMAGGARPNDIATASVFTTQSVDAISRQIRSQLSAGPASFTLGAAGERTVFPLSTVAGIQLRRQTGTTMFAAPSFLPTPALSIFPGSVGAIAFGSYASPNYENAAGVIPATGTRAGTPVPQSMGRIQFTLFLPAGATPVGGWPTAIFGHGFTDSKDGAPWVLASSLAHSGIATMAINVVGHGGGALGTYTVLRTSGAPVTLPSGGRGIDQDGNGTIDSTEGVNAVGAQSLIGSRGGLRQTTIDLMQLVKEIRGGVDADGDGSADLSTSRIYYAGQSFGGIYGVQLLGLEPDIRAGVPNVPGGSIIEIARLGGLSAARGDLPDHADTIALQRGAECVVHIVHREHPAPRPGAHGRHRARRVRDPGPDRQHRVGAAGREPGGVRAVHHPAGDHPVRARRQDGSEPDHDRDPASRPARVARDALPQRPRVRGEPTREQKPAHLPDEHHRTGCAVRARRPAADRHVLRKRWSDHHRPGRDGAVVRDPHVDASGGPRVHSVAVGP